MKNIKDAAMIAKWVREKEIQACFDTQDIAFQGRQYEKGEYITVPYRPLKELLFLIEGTVRIYGLRSDGSISPVNQHEAPILLGDIEFSSRGTPLFFTEAVTNVSCVCVDIDQYYEQLQNDVRFLHTLLRSYEEKLQLFAFVDAQAASIEERVLLYMQNYCPEQELHGIEAAVLQLRCSRRQLQRVLHKLCENGSVQKLGKGRYRLVSEPFI